MIIGTYIICTSSYLATELGYFYQVNTPHSNNNYYSNKCSVHSIVIIIYTMQALCRVSSD